MASCPELAQLIDRVTYKPGWKIQVCSVGFDCELLIERFEYDANKTHRGEHSTGPRIPIMFRVVVPRHCHDWLSWLRHQIEYCEKHEIDEFLRVDGKRVREPHPERKPVPV